MVHDDGNDDDDDVVDNDIYIGLINNRGVAKWRSEVSTSPLDTHIEVKEEVRAPTTRPMVFMPTRSSALCSCLHAATARRYCSLSPMGGKRHRGIGFNRPKETDAL